MATASLSGKVLIDGAGFRDSSCRRVAYGDLCPPRSERNRAGGRTPYRQVAHQNFDECFADAMTAGADQLGIGIVLISEALNTEGITASASGEQSGRVLDALAGHLRIAKFRTLVNAAPRSQELREFTKDSCRANIVCYSTFQIFRFPSTGPFTETPVPDVRVAPSIPSTLAIS